MANHNLTDNELVFKFMEGNESCIEELVNRHKTRIFTYIIIKVKSQQLAEDIFQDVFVKVIKSLKAGKYKEEGRFVPWVIRIAHNLTIDHFRKNQQMRTVSSSNDDYDILNSTKFSDATVEQTMIKEQVLEDVKALLELLPDDQKEVVILRHFVGLSFKEISEQTGVSINTALGRMRYALINLRKMVEEKNMNLSFS